MEAFVLPFFTQILHKVYYLFTFPHFKQVFRDIKIGIHIATLKHMKPILIFLNIWFGCAFVSANCNAADDFSNLTPDDKYLLKNLLNEDTFNKHYESYLTKKMFKQMSFMDYEIVRYKRLKRVGAIKTVLGSVFFATSVASIIFGIWAYADVDDCEERNQNRDDDGDWGGGEMCGLGYLFSAGSFAIAGATGILSTVFFVSGIRKLKESRRVLPRLHRLNSYSKSRVIFQGVSFAGNANTNYLGLTFGF